MFWTLWASIIQTRCKTTVWIAWLFFSQIYGDNGNFSRWKWKRTCLIQAFTISIKKLSGWTFKLNDCFWYKTRIYISPHTLCWVKYCYVLFEPNVQSWPWAEVKDSYIPTAVILLLSWHVFATDGHPRSKTLSPQVYDLTRRHVVLPFSKEWHFGQK